MCMKKRLRWNTEMFLPNLYINLIYKNISTIWQEMSPPRKESNIRGKFVGVIYFNKASIINKKYYFNY